MPSSLLRAAIAYVLLAAAALALYWWPEAKFLAGDEGHYLHTAHAVLAGGDWFDSRLVWPPLQGLFIAAIQAVFGPSIVAVQLVQLLLLAGSALLLWRLLRALTGDAATAAWAGVLLAVNPLSVGFATYLWPEIVHLSLSLVLAWALFAAHRAAANPLHHRQALLWAAVAGGSYGLCLLSKSLLAAFWPFLLLPLLALQGRRFAKPGAGAEDRAGRDEVAAESERRMAPEGPVAGSGLTRFMRIAVFAIAALLLTAPALHRGWQETGRPMIADSSWFNLWVGLTDRWRGDLVLDKTGLRLAEYLGSADDHAGRVAFAQGQVRTIVADQGLVATFAAQLSRQYFRLFDARTFVVAQLPGESCAGYLSRYRLQPGALAAAIDLTLRAWHLGLLVLFAFGLAAWRGWRRPWLWLVGAFVAYQLALLGLLHVKTRFLLPMLPVLCLFAGHAIARWQAQRSVTPSTSDATTIWSPERLATALLLAGALVALATLGPYLDRACG